VATQCQHLDTVEFLEPPAHPAGCEDCLKMGGRWVHLRMCMACGHIGCCDSSPNKHATAHHFASAHPIVTSAEPGETWSWCYEDQLMLGLREA
jgi:hypothetical protein